LTVRVADQSARAKIIFGRMFTATKLALLQRAASRNAPMPVRASSAYKAMPAPPTFPQLGRKLAH